MKVILNVELKKEKVFIFIRLLKNNMKVNGKMINLQDLDYIIIKMGIFTKENLIKEKETGMENINISKFYLFNLN